MPLSPTRLAILLALGAAALAAIGMTTMISRHGAQMEEGGNAALHHRMHGPGAAGKDEETVNMVPHSADPRMLAALRTHAAEVTDMAAMHDRMQHPSGT
jgi:hypothetical protein